MMQTTTITKKWQMTLPKKIRELLAITQTGEVVIEVVSKKEKIIKIKKSPSIMDLAGCIPAKNKEGKNIDLLNIREYIEKNYKRI